MYGIKKCMGSKKLFFALEHLGSQLPLKVATLGGRNQFSNPFEPLSVFCKPRRLPLPYQKMYGIKKCMGSKKLFFALEHLGSQLPLKVATLGGRNQFSNPFEPLSVFCKPRRLPLPY